MRAAVKRALHRQRSNAAACDNNNNVSTQCEPVECVDVGITRLPVSCIITIKGLTFLKISARRLSRLYSMNPRCPPERSRRPCGYSNDLILFNGNPVDYYRRPYIWFLETRCRKIARFRRTTVSLANMNFRCCSAQRNQWKHDATFLPG